MSEPTTTESGRREPGAVEALARDDVERKKFLSMAGRGIGAGATATGLAAFIAACGSSTSSSSIFSRVILTERRFRATAWRPATAFDQSAAPLLLNFVARSRTKRCEGSQPSCCTCLRW
jgi:hypothetical protein